LVAEDDRASREMIVAFLELQGHVVVSVHDGAAAVLAKPVNLDELEQQMMTAFARGT
jgi:CheY-like chemotaxis protein